MESFTVTADFAINGTPAGGNLAEKFKPVSQGVWELKLAEPIKELKAGSVVVSVKDKQGNESRIRRSFAIQKAGLSASN